MIRYFWPAIVIFCAPVLAEQAQINKPNDQVIEHITTKVYEPIDRDEENELSQYLSSLLQKKADANSLIEAEKRLNLLSRYKYIVCDFDQSTEITTLHCTLDRIPVIRQVVIQNLPIILLEKDLRKRLSMHAGQAFDDESSASEIQIARLQQTVISFLERQGYYDAQVSVRTQPIAQTSTIDVVVTIEDGSFLMVRNVTLSDGVSFDRDKISSMFKKMCRNFRYAFDALGMYGFSCYSREKEREVTRFLQTYFTEKGFDTASIYVQRTLLDPLASDTPKPCKAKAEERVAFEAKGLTPPSRCVDLNVSVDLGPKITTEFIFAKDAQTITLAPIGKFFRTLFGVEFFSRLLNTSLIGAKWPADETIIINDLKNALTFQSSQKVDEREIAESIENMKSVLSTRGYANAHIEVEQERLANKAIFIRFIINQGQPYTVTKIQFVKNPVFSAEQLRADVSLTVTPRSALSTGHFDPDLLAADIESLKIFYLNHGYPNAQIEVEKQLIPGEGITLLYQVDAGEKQIVRDLEIENGESSLLSQILPLLSNCQNAKTAHVKALTSTSVCSNSPYLANAVLDDEKRIIDVYRANGYLYTQVQTKAIETENGANIVFSLNSENPQVKVAGVLVDGNIITRRYVLLRHLGDSLFSPETILKPLELEEGIGKLRRTNLYSRIAFRYLGEAEKKEEVYVLLTVVEKPSLIFDLSLGFSTDNWLSLGAELKESNLFGSMLELGNQLSLGLFWGQQSSYKNALRWPSIYGLPLDFDLIIPQFVYENRLNREPPERHFLSQIIASLKWRLSPSISPYIKYEIRFDKWQQRFDPRELSSDLAHIFSTVDGLTVVLGEPSTTRGILTPGISYINVDHPFDPKKGVKLNFSVDLSYPFLGAQIPFQTVNAQLVHYATTGPITFATQLILRRAFINDPQTTWWVLKYQSDMDTLGGDRSVRGYQLGTIGLWGPLLNSINGTPITVNGSDVEGFHPGNLILQGNFEIRFPLAKNFLIGDLNGAVFTDAAFINNCQELFQCDDASPYLTPSGQDRRVGFSVGVGLRYVLPVGPIALDYGISPIHRSDGFLGRESRVHLLFGYTF